MAKKYAQPIWNITGIVSLFLFLGTFIYLSFVISENSKNENELREKTLEAELRLSEKLEQEKENEQLLSQLQRVKDDLAETTNSFLRKSEELLASKDQIKSLQATSMRSKVIKDLKDEIADLKAKHLTDSINLADKLFAAELQQENFRHSADDRLYERTQYIERIDDLARARIDNVLVEPLTRRNKLTSKASRTRTVKVSTQVSDKLNDLNFSITNPKGKTLDIGGNNSAVNEVKSPNLHQAFYIAPDIMLGITDPKKEIQIVFMPQEKLKPGIYQINLITKKDTIANIRFSLR